ncbi:hypothetical protein [Aquabacterium sp. A08]|uniref:hypothetical protein n=1 Tax=Aquabacterium sp. A08 TaxID=2718532 RepID=UPI00142256CD|nr:hypothetical protein [Aquabacterium sp. A08]NIC40748.1 hypothetical protein [Aquabacterium sp. A08]
MKRIDQWSWKMPRGVPPLSVMLDDLSNPPPVVLARCFGVSERTVRRWVRHDSAPRPVLFAVFWLTSWGRQTVHLEAENAARMHAGLYECLRRENAALMARIGRLEALGDFGSANLPHFTAKSLQVWG